jgi:hypothetical protein
MRREMKPAQGAIERIATHCFRSGKSVRRTFV